MSETKYKFNKNSSLKNVCESSEKLMYYLQYKAENHKAYKVYTKIDRLEYWIQSHSVFLGTGSRWNDTTDREHFNNGNLLDIKFGMCLSFSHSENVAMWMLYGGTRHNGVMINFKPTQIKRLRDTTKFIELGTWKDNEFVSMKNLNMGEFNIILSDVLYYGPSKEGNNCYDIKRSNEVHNVEDIQMIENLMSVKKYYPWNYENECRLIVSIPRKLVPEGADTVKIDIGNTYSDLIEEKRIFEAPNFKGDNKYQKSTLKGTIDWDLCLNCNKICSVENCKNRKNSTNKEN